MFGGTLFVFLQFWSSKLWIRISLKRYGTQIAHISMLFHLSVSFTLQVPIKRFIGFQSSAHFKMNLWYFICPAAGYVFFQFKLLVPGLLFFKICSGSSFWLFLTSKNKTKDLPIVFVEFCAYRYHLQGEICFPQRL